MDGGILPFLCIDPHRRIWITGPRIGGRVLGGNREVTDCLGCVDDVLGQFAVKWEARPAWCRKEQGGLDNRCVWSRQASECRVANLRRATRAVVTTGVMNLRRRVPGLSLLL